MTLPPTALPQASQNSSTESLHTPHSRFDPGIDPVGVKEGTSSPKHSTQKSTKGTRWGHTLKSTHRRRQVDIHRQTDRHTGRQTDRQEDRQTDRHLQTDTHRQSPTHTNLYCHNPGRNCLFHVLIQQERQQCLRKLPTGVLHERLSQRVFVISSSCSSPNPIGENNSTRSPPPHQEWQEIRNETSNCDDNGDRGEACLLLSAHLLPPPCKTRPHCPWKRIDT